MARARWYKDSFGVVKGVREGAVEHLVVWVLRPMCTRDLIYASQSLIQSHHCLACQSTTHVLTSDFVLMPDLARADPFSEDLFTDLAKPLCACSGRISEALDVLPYIPTLLPSDVRDLRVEKIWNEVVRVSFESSSHRIRLTLPQPLGHQHNHIFVVQ